MRGMNSDRLPGPATSKVDYEANRIAGTWSLTDLDAEWIDRLEATERRIPRRRHSRLLMDALAGGGFATKAGQARADVQTAIKRHGTSCLNRLQRSWGTPPDEAKLLRMEHRDNSAYRQGTYRLPDPKAAGAAKPDHTRQQHPRRRGTGPVLPLQRWWPHSLGDREWVGIDGGRAGCRAHHGPARRTVHRLRAREDIRDGSARPTSSTCCEEHPALEVDHAISTICNYYAPTATA